MHQLHNADSWYQDIRMLDIEMSMQQVCTAYSNAKEHALKSKKTSLCVCRRICPCDEVARETPPSHTCNVTRMVCSGHCTHKTRILVLTVPISCILWIVHASSSASICFLCLLYALSSVRTLSDGLLLVIHWSKRNGILTESGFLLLWLSHVEKFFIDAFTTEWEIYRWCFPRWETDS